MFIEPILKKRALKKYIILLPKELKQRYHGSPYYSEGQIEATIKKLKLSKKYLKYAFVMFAEPQNRSEILMRRYGIINHSLLREKVADMFFNGNEDFIIKHKVYEWRGGKQESQMVSD